MTIRRSVYIATSFIGLVFGGINWKVVWLEPKAPLTLTVGESQPYTVMGLDGSDTKANLTKSRYLKISSSDTNVLEVDQEKAVLIGKKPGRTVIRISFGQTSNVKLAVVK
jgi:hypothetical protein